MIYEDFVEDYNNMNLTAHDVRRIHKLNSKQYSKIRKQAVENGDISLTRHMNTTNAKFYTQTKDGFWTVQKQYGHDKIRVGRFPNETTAKMIVEKCKEVNWQLNEIKEIIDANKIKPKNYTIVNGYYLIQKTKNGVLTTYFSFKQSEISEEKVKEIVDKCRELDWTINDKKQVLKEVGICS